MFSFLKAALELDMKEERKKLEMLKTFFCLAAAAQTARKCKCRRRLRGAATKTTNDFSKEGPGFDTQR